MHQKSSHPSFSDRSDTGSPQVCMNTTKTTAPWILAAGAALRAVRKYLLPWIVLLLGAGSARAQEASAPAAAADLAKKLNNPVSDLVSVPFQFFNRFQGMEGVAPAMRPGAPRNLGLSLILAGILSLAIAAWQYHQMIRYLWSGEFKALAGVQEVQPRRTPILAVAIALLLIGVYAFIAVFFRLQ